MSQVDPKVVNDIVDRLKKRGLFDKFRKQCLADIDTKVGTCSEDNPLHYRPPPIL